MGQPSIWLMVILTIVGCNSQPSNYEQKITELKADDADKNQALLVDTYMAYAASVATDEPAKALGLYQKAGLLLSEKGMIEQTDMLINHMSQLMEDDTTQAATQFAHSIETEINQLDKQLLDKQGKIHLPTAKKFVSHIVTYSKVGNDKEKLVKYAYAAAETAKNIGDIPQSIYLYDAMMAKYPNDNKIMSNALFGKAFIVENNLKDLEQAKSIYERILVDYPDMEITKNIPVIIENLGKSPEEIMKGFKKKK